MRKCVYASLSGVMALLVALGTGVDAAVPRDFFVRATKYHKDDPECDSWTKQGKTSTQLRLPPDHVVLDRNQIGFVAVDPAYVPIGSLVYEVQTGRFFVATRGGEAVISRDAAIESGKNSAEKNAPVFDFYFPEREIVDTGYTICWVIPHEGDAFTGLRLKYQKLRLKPHFWFERIQKLYDSSSSEEDRFQLRQMMNRLKEMKN